MAHSEETKRKISAANMGHRHSAETRQLFSEQRRGKPSPATRERLLGVKHPPDCSHCEAVRQSNTRRKLSEEERVSRRKAAGRACRLRALYGIEVEDYDRLFAAQGGACAICKKTCSTGKRLAVDHDHATGVVRGLLCRRCNRGIGHFNDTTTLREALTYLERSC